MNLKLMTLTMLLATVHHCQTTQTVRQLLEQQHTNATAEFEKAKSNQKKFKLEDYMQLSPEIKNDFLKGFSICTKIALIEGMLSCMNESISNTPKKCFCEISQEVIEGLTSLDHLPEIVEAIEKATKDKESQETLHKNISSDFLNSFKLVQQEIDQLIFNPDNNQANNGNKP